MLCPCLPLVALFLLYRSRHHLRLHWAGRGQQLDDAEAALQGGQRARRRGAAPRANRPGVGHVHGEGSCTVVFACLPVCLPVAASFFA